MIIIRLDTVTTILRLASVTTILRLDTMTTFLRLDTVTTILKPVLKWANVCSPEHTSDTSTNYDSFLN